MCKYLMGSFTELNSWCFAGELVQVYSDEPRGLVLCVNICRVDLGAE